MNWVNFRLITAAVAAINCFILCLLIGRKKTVNDTNKIFVVFNFFLGLWNASDLIIAFVDSQSLALFFDRLSYIWATLVILFFFLFCQKISGLEFKNNFYKRILISALFFLISITFTPWLIVDVKIGAYFEEIPGLLYFCFILYFLTLLWAGLRYLYIGYTQSFGFKKNQLKYIFASLIFTFLGSVSYIITMVLPMAPPLFYVFEIFYIWMVTYTIIKYKVMDINLVFRYTAIYVLSFMMIGVPASTLVWWSRDSVISLIIVFFTPFIGYLFLKNMIPKTTTIIDRLSAFKQYQAQKELPDLKLKIGNSSSLEQWCKRTVWAANRLIETDCVSILFYDQSVNRFILKDGIGLESNTKSLMSLEKDSGLIRFLESEKAILFKGYVGYVASGAAVKDILEDMNFIQAEICVPFFNGEKLVAILSCGRKIKQGQMSFCKDDFNMPLLQDYLNRSFPINPSQRVVDNLLREKISALGSGEDQIVAVFNELVNMPELYTKVKVKNPYTFELRCEALKLFEKALDPKAVPLTKSEVSILNRGLLESIFREALSMQLEEEIYNDENENSLLALSRAAGETLNVIFATRSHKIRTAEWSHDLVHPFKKGALNEIASILSGKYGVISDELKEVLSQQQHAVQFVQRHIGTLIDPDRFMANIQPCFLTDIFNAAKINFSPTAEEKNIHWVVQAPPKDILVLCDDELIEFRVLPNLVGNAFRHTPKNGTIELGYLIKDKKFIGYIKDTGCGIAKEKIATIFERGTQYGEDRGLAGLGLYNVAKTMEEHKGKVWVESEPGKGSTFYFELPLA